MKWFISSGVGFQIVRFLAQRGAKVYLTSRSNSKARQARDTLLDNYPDIDQKKIDWLSLDMTDLKSVDAASQELNKREGKVDILSMAPESWPIIRNASDV